MVDAVTVATAQHAKLVRNPGDVREEIADLKAGLAAWVKRLDGAKQRVARYFAARHHLAKTARQRLAGVLGQIRLGVKQIHVARSAVHEQPNDTPDPWSEMRLPRRERIGRARPSGPRLLLHQARQGQAANPAAGFQQKLPPIALLLRRWS